MAPTLKRCVAVVTIAAGLSTFGPVASSFYVFSSFRAGRDHGGISVIYKSAGVPDWLAGNSLPCMANDRPLDGGTTSVAEDPIEMAGPTT